MNRWLQYLNLFGVLALALLCVFQWRMNRELNLETNRLERTCAEQTTHIEKQSRNLKGTMEDLETFREQLTRANVELKEQTSRSAANEAKVDALVLERDALKNGLANWTNAVAERDQRLQKSDKEIQTLANDLNAAVKKFNGLATNYNAVVEQLNQLQNATSKEAK